MNVEDARTRELADNLAGVRDRIAQAAKAVGRSEGDVTLIAITKFWPAQDVRRLAELGVSDVGENRDQEASVKHEQCADLGLVWHFVGQLQRNKAASVARYADVVQSVDRVSLVLALQKAAERVGRKLGVCLQVDLTQGAPGRGGAAEAELLDLAGVVFSQPNLVLRGLMGVAPLGLPPEPGFARLAQLSAQLVGVYPAANMVSAGMSSDLEAAISAGATHVRIGTALMGSRWELR